jgi:uncharacterized membrane protein
MENAMIESKPVKGRQVDAGRGVHWWTQAWGLFMKAPGMWLLFGLGVLVGSIVLGVVPVLGGLAVALLMQIVVGGWMLSARKLESGGSLEPADLLAGFKSHLNPLLVLGALALGACIVIFAVMALFGGGAMMGMMAGGMARSAGGMAAGAFVGLLTLLAVVALSFVFAMAFWFAPALVVFRQLAPVDAVKASWAASLSNIAAFVVYGLLWIVASVVASIPFGLGWLVLMPLTVLGMYCAYQDIFEGADPDR